jgi:MFS family permease
LQTLFLSVEAIIPLYVKRNHPTLGISEVALIMVFTEVAGFILSPLIGSFLEKFGRKNVILTGFVTISIGTALLAMTDLIENDTEYMFASIICRFIQGAGDQ